ncbi:MAG: class I tRNA ligase family protein [Candidatus Magasanikbacteria bacterium]|nr:class I tRNA ligase family protein [Candidatus Magasanikbacteria bacterium]
MEKSVGNKNLILSSDDPYIKKETHKNLPPGWFYQLWSGFGHFQQKQIPELLNLILQSKNTGWVPLPESELPLKLPKVEKYQPTDTGESPLAAMEKWVKTKCPNCGGPAKRETDTMPNWAGSSWYFLAYAMGGKKRLKEKGDKFWDKEMLKHWQPVDWYNGGMEHTVLHLLYSRFWNQFLYDIGMVPTPEPYAKRTSHGMILAKGGEKMSKSRGNVVNPDEMVEQFGADALRTYIMFMGPFDQAVEWDTNGLVGVKRFLDKVWRLGNRIGEHKLDHPWAMHKTIAAVSARIDSMSFNTAISEMMVYANLLENHLGENKENGTVSREAVEALVLLLSPFAPHLCEQIWSQLGHEKSIAFEKWPEANQEELEKKQNINLAVQVNGKLRDTVTAWSDISEEEAKKAALASEKIQKWLEGKEPKKVIYVKGKLVSIVV